MKTVEKATEKLSYWVAGNPIITAAAVPVTLESRHYDQAIEMQRINTESMIGTDSTKIGYIF